MKIQDPTVSQIVKFMGGIPLNTGKTQELRTVSNKLMYGDVALVYRLEGYLLLNNTKYNKRSSAHQNVVRRLRPIVMTDVFLGKRMRLIEGSEDTIQKLVGNKDSKDLALLVEVMENLGTTHMVIN